MQDLVETASVWDIKLSPAQLEQFQAYYDDLVDWNHRVNLTSITDYHETQLKHFVDSLSIVVALSDLTSHAYHIIDVGTGAGFPGLPLKIAFPQIQLTLLEATGKKCDFLRHVIQRLGLCGVDVLCARSEEVAHMPEYREQFDVVVSRGLAKMAVLSELTLPFCKVGAKTIAQKKGDVTNELECAANSIAILGGYPAQIIPVTIPEIDDQRCLVVVEKAASSPLQYPRRNGMPNKRPLC